MKFKPEDFSKDDLRDLECSGYKGQIEIFNMVLDRKLKDARTVYHSGAGDIRWLSGWTENYVSECDTHKAKLVEIEKL